MVCDANILVLTIGLGATVQGLCRRRLPVRKAENTAIIGANARDRAELQKGYTLPKVGHRI